MRLQEKSCPDSPCLAAVPWAHQGFLSGNAFNAVLNTKSKLFAAKVGAAGNCLCLSWQR